jgi:phosphatidylglycerol:prolipoprotein diacylglycerol transferase
VAVVIEINIDPNLVEAGPLVLAWHGIFTAVGILAGIWLAAAVMRWYGLSDEPIYNGAIVAVPSAILGARILYIAGNWSQFANDPLNMLRIWVGGISVWGAVVGGIIGGTIYAVRSRTPLGQFADAAGLALLFGMAIGRIGDIINGEHLGKPTSVPWSVRYTHPDTLGERGVPVHLAVGYEMVWDLAALGLLLWLMRRLRMPGIVFWLFLVLYSIGRFWTHFYRTDGAEIAGLEEAQFIALIGLAIAIPGLLIAWRRVSGRQRREPVAAGERAGAELAGGERA